MHRPMLNCCSEGTYSRICLKNLLAVFENDVFAHVKLTATVDATQQTSFGNKATVANISKMNQQLVLANVNNKLMFKTCTLWEQWLH